jgi:hypothetical protein
MGERILFEYRANEADDHDRTNHKLCRRAWRAHGAARMPYRDWDHMMASPEMKPGAMGNTLEFFEGIYRDLFGEEESE